MFVRIDCLFVCYCMNDMYVWIVNIKAFELTVVLNFGDEILLRGRNVTTRNF